MQNGTEKLPRWSLNKIYKSFTDPEYRKDIERFSALLVRFSGLCSGPVQVSTEEWAVSCVSALNEIYDLHEEIESFAYCMYSTNTQDSTALKELNRIEELSLPLHSALVAFRNRLAEITQSEPGLPDREVLSDSAFYLKEQLYLQSRQMTEAEEALAADLSRSGGDAWSRLQESISSTLSCIWDENTGGKKTVTELRDLAYHPDREVRERAFKKETGLWEQAKIPLAFALNGVKGFTTTLDKRRKYSSPLEKAMFQARISEKALSALLSVIRKNLETFRKYLRLKAQILGIGTLAFYDLFAPVETEGRVWGFQEAEDFILQAFGRFSQELAGFAQHCFDSGWIDAEPRSGKIGGAYCISFPAAGESRVFTNFNGSISSVTTLAHELGHAYHHEVLKDIPAVGRRYPMTLAETASIFSETLCIEYALAELSPREQVPMLEVSLQDATQTIVDIYSRFLFESRVFERRKTNELTPDEFCGLMLEAQRETYGNALDEEQLHPYMWAVKGHYYSQHLSFYNFPYAFGQLFGLGLFGLSERMGSDFPELYKRLLLQTGAGTAQDVTREAGFDIEEETFWQSGIDLLAGRIGRLASFFHKTPEA